MKRIGTQTTTFFVLALAALALAGASFADDGGHNGDNRGAKGEHRGEQGEHHKGNGKDGGGDKGKHARATFTVVTTDNGSCGTPWATDTVKRTFVVKSNGDGTYRLTRIDRGSFVTLAAASPGACEQGSDHGKVVAAGVTGKLRGFITGTVTGGTFNPNAMCAAGAQCGFTDTFIATYFGPSAQFSCFAASSTDCRFDFNYRASDNQPLLFDHWRDSGTGSGTALREEFRGDIATA